MACKAGKKILRRYMSSKKIISNQMTHTPLPPPHNPQLQSQFYNNWANPRALIASDW